MFETIIAKLDDLDYHVNCLQESFKDGGPEMNDYSSSWDFMIKASDVSKIIRNEIAELIKLELVPKDAFTQLHERLRASKEVEDARLAGLRAVYEQDLKINKELEL